MKKYHRLSSISFFVVLCVMVVGFSAHAQEKVIKLKFAHYLPPMHKIALLGEQWCKELEKRTNGRVQVAYFPGGVLIPGNQAYQGAVRGIADISHASPSWDAGRFPLSEVLELPLGYTNSMQATGLANAFYKRFQPKEFDDTKMLWLRGAAPGAFMTTKPVSSIEGLKGLKIRGGGNQSKIVSAMGAVPVSVPNADIYESLQRGVAQGMFFYPESLKGWKYGDLIRGLQDNPGINGAGIGVYVMNKQKWNSLPPDIQKIIDEMSEEWAKKEGEIWVELDKEGREYGVSKGMKIFMISEEEGKKSAEKVKPLFDEYVKDMKAKGLPGEEALKFCRDYLKTHR